MDETNVPALSPAVVARVEEIRQEVMQMHHHPRATYLSVGADGHVWAGFAAAVERPRGNVE
jgi:hypothetical protein